MCASRESEVRRLRIAECRAADLTVVEAILRASPEAADWSALNLAGAQYNDPAHFLIGRQDEEIVGFIAGRRAADEAEILNLAVLPGARRRGVGSQLVQELLAVFVRAGVLRVFLEVRESNAAAIGLYQVLGFRKVGERRGYYRNPEETALLFAKQIAEKCRPGE